MKTRKKTEISRLLPEEFKLIFEIAQRASAMADEVGQWYDPLEAMMDISSTYINGIPLRLQALLDADDGNFSHDVFGIRRHLDRETGKLKDCFVPRFAR